MGKNKIIIDEDACIGCGTCVALCPDNFELRGDKAVVITKELDDINCVNDAIESCPTTAIKKEES
jgi:ferredoxin